MSDSLIWVSEDEDTSIQLLATERVRRDTIVIESPLQSVENRVRQRLADEQERIDILHTKREVERAHSRYLQQNVSDQRDLREAQAVAHTWAKQNANKRVPNVRAADRPRAAVLGSLDVQLQCPVINCAVKFTSGIKKQEHIHEFMHSPCNPFLLSPDGSSGAERFYGCPQCQYSDQDAESCLDHMITASHLDTGEPVEMNGYTCPTCLHLFINKESCQDHMTSLRHQQSLYPFPGDIERNGADPVPVPSAVVNELVRLCRVVAWSLECVVCGKKILTTEDYLIHRQRAQCQNMVMALAEQSVAEVFRHFVKPFSCSECRGLIDSLEGASCGDVIRCNHNNSAILMQNDCRTFYELLCRHALLKLPHSLVSNVEETSPHSVGTSEVGDRAVNNALTPSSQTRNSGTVVGRPSQGQHSQHSMNSSSRVNMVAPSQRGDSRELATTSRKRLAVSPETERASKVRLLDLPLPWVSEEKVDTIESEAAVLYAHNVCAPELSFKQPAVGVTSEQPTIGLSGRSSLGISTKESTLGLSCTETTKGLSSKRVAVCSSHTSLPNIQNKRTPGIAQETTTHDSSMNKVLKTVPYKIHKTVPSSEFPQNLEQMKHIIFLDLDNWANFFGHLPERLPDKTYVWGFYGGKRSWFEPRHYSFQYLKSHGWFHLHEKCGFTKDAADFALALAVGRMDERLPKEIPFTIISGDKGFCELERQMKRSARRAVVINPHRQSEQMVFILIKSVQDA